MCIICYKPVHADMPTEEMIRDMWDNNPHGAGWLYIRPDDDMITIAKGYMDVDQFIDDINSIHPTKEDLIVMHFRISTYGGVRAGLCHPFPLSKRKRVLNELDVQCKRAFVHNGVLGQGNESLSDSQLYVKKNFDILNDFQNYAEEISESTLGSRTLCVGVEDGVLMTGEWRYKDGLFFSNENYTPKLIYTREYTSPTRTISNTYANTPKKYATWSWPDSMYSNNTNKNTPEKAIGYNVNV